MPKISVIVPVYKVEEYLDRCVCSILNQTFKDFELILVDDGSPDRCPAICDGYATKYSFVHVIHKENGGLSDARNAGIDWAFVNSDSEWLTFIDSDDWVHKQYLEILYNGAKNNNTTVSCCSLQKTSVFFESDEITIDKPYVDNAETLYCNDILEINSSAGRLFYKELFYNVRFPKGQLLEDQATIYKILFSTEKVCIFQVSMYFYYINPNGIMGKNAKDDSLKLLSLSISLISAKWLYNHHFYNANKKVLQEISNVIFQICDYFEDADNGRTLEKAIRAERKKVFKRKKQEAIKLLKEDYLQVKQEKGYIYAFLWKAKVNLKRVFKSKK